MNRLESLWNDLPNQAKDSNSLEVAISNLPIFHTYFCDLNYTPSINVSQAAVPVNGSQCFVLRNALYWIKIHAVFIEIQQIKV